MGYLGIAIKIVVYHLLLLPQLNLEFFYLLGCRNTLSEILEICAYSCGFFPCLSTAVLRIKSSGLNWGSNIVKKQANNKSRKEKAMSKIVMNILTILLLIIELLLLFVLKDIPFISNVIENIENKNLLSWLPLLLPSSGILYAVNFSFISPLIYKFILWLGGYLGYFKIYRSQFESVIAKTVKWLTSNGCRWGPYENSNIMQNANTCEGLLALISTRQHKRYLRIYDESLNSVVKNATLNGLPSKSLSKETVVCTSLLIIIAVYDKEKNNGKVVKSLTPYKKMGKVLWECRSSCGWGVFMCKTNEPYCSFANTFRALFALLMIKNVRPIDLNLYIRSIYELSDNSLFGFTPNDQPRMTTTALSIIIYYNLSISAQKLINEVYDVNEAIQYVISTFCNDDYQQSEIETLEGINNGSNGIKKIPWTHISSGYAIKAICIAYKNHDLNSFFMNKFLKKVRKICDLNVITLPNDMSYYIPNNMITNQGIATYPSAYLLYGLSSVLDIL